MTNPYDLLQPRPGAAKAEPSEPRLHIRKHFDAMTAARGRGVSWQQITAAMAAAGVRGAGAAELGWRQVKSLYHAERYARGEKRKRRKPAPKLAKAEATAPARQTAEASRPAPVPTAPASAPAPPAAAHPGDAAHAEGLRALLARRRPDLREPAPINLGPEDRRPRQETDEDA